MRTQESVDAQIAKLKTEAAEAGDMRTVWLCDRVQGWSVKDIANLRKATIGFAAAEREIRTVLLTEECRSQNACIRALLPHLI